jgi:hypothetical protein
MLAPNDPQKVGWQKMQHALNISRPYQEEISQKSTDPRHGDKSRVEGETTSEIVERTWVIMNRFLCYRLQQNKPLMAPEFPLLDASGAASGSV